MPSIQCPSIVRLAFERTVWPLAGASLLDRSGDGEEETKAEEAAALIAVVVDCRRCCCWELFAVVVVTARALAELDAAAERGIRDGAIAALRAERRSIVVKLVERDELRELREKRKERERAKKK